MRAGRPSRTLSYVALALVVAAALVVGVVDRGEARTVEERVHDIASTIRCPACRGQSAAGSDAASAQAIRVEIAERVEAGESDDDIRAYFAATQGDEILLTPPRSGVGSLVWVIPVVVLVAGGAGLALAFHRWKRWG
jgi:cytochrome c-type biogenesis protein CcmH